VLEVMSSATLFAKQLSCRLTQLAAGRVCGRLVPKVDEGSTADVAATIGVRAHINRADLQRIGFDRGARARGR
jgi:hypothetical protein